MRPYAQQSDTKPSRPQPPRGNAGAPPAPSGDGGAQPLLAVFTTLRQTFRRVAVRLLEDEDEADDVLQDAFCRLWPRRETIRTKNEAAALANVTVKHLCIDTLRGRKGISRIDEADTPDLPDDSDSQQEREERFRAVEEAANACLTPVQQQILRLRDYEDKPYAEIALSLGMTEEAVRMQLSRARKTVRQQWRNYLRE